MSSIPLENKQWDSTWDGLPAEIRLLILEALMQDGCKLSRFATVSRQWQTAIERHNFARIKLTQWRLVDFDSMVHRNRNLVRYLWFCLELEDYDCRKCAPLPGMTNQEWYDAWEEVMTVTDTDHCPITTSFHNLFSILNKWDPNGHLTLDISIYSPSDSQHWFKYLTFLPDASPDTPGRCSMEQTMVKRNFHDPRHGWVDGFRHSAPSEAILKVFHSIMDEGPFDSEELEYQWWDQLPSVPVVTSLLLRQQNRRRWKPDSLAHMFARFPRLEELHYEPWREWSWMHLLTDRSGFLCIPARNNARLYCRGCSVANYVHPDLEDRYLFESIRRFNTNLKRLVVFENFNQQYPVIMQRFQYGEDLADCQTTRNPAPAVSQMIALASLKLEHLAASFIVDARHFFETEPSWEWPNLTSLVLTSKILTPDDDPTEIGSMLQAAAAAATKMPKLETMEIWNGRKGIAALFKYHASRDERKATITWRSTWNLAMEASVIEAWEAIIDKFDGWRLNVVEEWLDESAIKSHGDAIHHLMLSGQVIRPVSLQQIQMEQKALEGVPTI